MNMENKKRSFIKALTWRAVASSMTMVTVYLLTKEWKMMLGAGLIDGAAKFVFYFLHERAWNVLEWGRKSEVEPVGDMGGMGVMADGGEKESASAQD